ncbi:MAG: hypothetical protein JRJ14_10715 [Deltaproteobacteria bacterium]|nr:hypothetical protein [Deltaproteobacteria bacterium]
MSRSAKVMRTALWPAGIMMAVLILAGNPTVGLAGSHEIDINALTQETQKMSQEMDDMTFVWWIPEEFWRVSFENEPAISQAETEEFLETLRPYTIVVVVDCMMGTFGGVTYKPERDIRNSLKFVDHRGNSYSPYGLSQVDADTKNFLDMMKPIFVNMLGPMGQNMHFFLFPAKDKSGNLIADAKSEGSFTVKLAERSFKWRLPLGSILPQKVCPVDGERMSGAWKYCPWHGVELKEIGEE